VSEDRNRRRFQLAEGGEAIFAACEGQIPWQRKPKRLQCVMHLPAFIRRRRQWCTVAAAVAALLLVGFFDAWNGWDVSLYVLYAPPTLFAGWFCKRRWALSISGFAAAVWAVANYPGHRYSSDEAYAWVAISRGIYFFLITFGVLAFRNWQREVRQRFRAIERRRELEKQIVRVAEQEQIRLGRELHDGVCQSLAAIDCAAACLSNDLAEAGSEGMAEVLAIQKMVRQALAETRALARGAFPVLTDDQSFALAVAELAKMMEQLYGVRVEVETEGRFAVPSPVTAMHLYRFTQEALSNALRHSKATSVRLRLAQRSGQLTLEVIDNGSGFAPGSAQAGDGMGLRSMRYRIEMVRGHLELCPTSGGGTTVRATLALPARMDPPAESEVGAAQPAS
jgi:signal transduction histidine kinase